MVIEFNGKINKPYMMVNTATFKLAGGGSIVIDRDSTEFTIEDGKIDMLWRNCYIWCINDVCLEEPYYPDNNAFIELMNGAELVELYLEDEADEDYEITDIIWGVS